jgi:hypothetical protein
MNEKPISTSILVSETGNWLEVKNSTEPRMQNNGVEQWDVVRLDSLLAQMQEGVKHGIEDENDRRIPDEESVARVVGYWMALLRQCGLTNAEVEKDTALERDSGLQWQALADGCHISGYWTVVPFRGEFMLLRSGHSHVFEGRHRTVALAKWAAGVFDRADAEIRRGSR